MAQKTMSEFVIVPRRVLESSAYLTLPAFAKLIFWLAVEALSSEGKNGHIEVARDWVSRRTPMDHKTITKYINVLIRHRLLWKTKNHGGNEASGFYGNLYALTWLPISKPAGLPLVNMPTDYYRTFDPKDAVQRTSRKGSKAVCNLGINGVVKRELIHEHVGCDPQMSGQKGNCSTRQKGICSTQKASIRPMPPVVSSFSPEEEF